eukprot:gene7860-12331_t
MIQEAITEFNNETYVEINFFVYDTKFTEGFGFSMDLNMTDNSIFTCVSQMTLHETSIFEGKKSNNSCVKKKIHGSLFESLDGVIHYSCSIPLQKFQKFNYILILRSSNTWNPDSDFDTIQKIIRPINSWKPCIVDTLSGRGRFDSRFWYLTVITSIIFLFTFLSLIYYRDEQPLKSRKYLPFIALLYNYSLLLSDFFQNLFSNEIRLTYGCLINIFITHRFGNIVASLPVLVLFRYFYLIHLTKQKKIIYNKTKEKLEISTFTVFLAKYLNLSTSLLGIFIFIIILYIVTLLLNIIPFFFYQTDCFEIANSLLYKILTGFTSILTESLIVIVLIVDLMMNIKSICRKKCGFLKFYFIDDIYYFRIESIMVWTVSMCFTFVPLFDDYSRLLKQISSTILWYFMFFTQVVFVLLVTSLRSWKIRKKNSIEKEEIEEIFDPEYDIILQAFLKFCESEFTSEYIYIKRDILKYRKNMRDRASIGKEIVALYLNGRQSILEVNVMESMSSDFKQRIQCGDFAEDLFDKIEREVDCTLKDSFRKFKLCKEYLIVKKVLDFQDKDYFKL